MFDYQLYAERIDISAEKRWFERNFRHPIAATQYSTAVKSTPAETVN